MGSEGWCQAGERVDEDLMKVSKGKCHLLLLGWSNPMHQYLLGTAQLESGLAEKVLGVLVDTELNVSHHCALVAKNANSLLSCEGGGPPSLLGPALGSPAQETRSKSRKTRG